MDHVAGPGVCRAVVGGDAHRECLPRAVGHHLRRVRIAGRLRVSGRDFLQPGAVRAVLDDGAMSVRFEVSADDCAGDGFRGGVQSGGVFKQPLRVVEVATGKNDSQGRPEILLLATNCLDLDAAWIALGYRYRWTIELFFRWFKCILGCQHLLSTCPNGVAIQVYMALIVSMVMVLWTGHKPTKATLEMLSCYFMGLASDAELMAHLRSLDEPKKKKS